MIYLRKPPFAPKISENLPSRQLHVLGNTRTSCEICLKLTIKTSKQRDWCRSGVFIVNYEYMSHLFLVFLLLTLNR